MHKKCQVFTPTAIADELLDLAGYCFHLYGKRIVESACGEGNILTRVVRRYIEDCAKQGMHKKKIAQGLARDVVGFDVDEVCCKKCISRLTDIANEYDLPEIRWAINASDFLADSQKQQYDFVISNPPYISYRDLSAADRKMLRDQFMTCDKGAFDYCYAFIEHGIKNLSNRGVLVYLIPSSIFKNVHAQSLRNLLLTHLTSIIDYTTQKLFDGILTSSAIIVCDKGAPSKCVNYTDVVAKREFAISKEILSGKWMFDVKNVASKASIEKKERFSDYFSASIVIATLLNKAFVIKNCVVSGNVAVTESGELLELGATKRAASPRALRAGKQELIIFPYYYDGGLKRYLDGEFEATFPNATAYLGKYREQLNERDSDKSVRWFEYGRSQALLHLNTEKLLVSTVVTKRIEVYSLPADCIPYAGIFIRQKGRLSLSVAERILKSADFAQYVYRIGIYANGSSVRITPRDIEGYEFELEE